MNNIDGEDSIIESTSLKDPFSGGSQDKKENPPNPNQDKRDSEGVTFKSLGLSDEILSAIKDKGFSNPTPIQKLVIPHLLTSEGNVIGKARTGTGKTAAFALPILQRLITSEKKIEGVHALILTPTRELAIQTTKEILSFCKSLTRTFSCACIYGGSPYPEQLRALKSAAIVVGTPGRVKDHITRGSLRLNAIDYFVLDEADEMLDLGFLGDVQDLFSCVKADTAPRDPKVLLFSATVSDPIKKIAKDFMGNYTMIEESEVKEPLLITQKFWIMRREEKVSALVRLIDFYDDFYGVVFVRTKSDADELLKALDSIGVNALALHGDIIQSERTKILDRFRKKKTGVLIATDVAARGLDIEGLTYVVNYSVPMGYPFDAETYVHRVGRTGRAGRVGIAITFVTWGEARKLETFRARLKTLGPGVVTLEEVPSVDEVLSHKAASIEYNIMKALGEKAPKNFRRMASFLWRLVDDDADRLDLLARVLAAGSVGALSREKYGEISREDKVFGRRSTRWDGAQDKKGRTPYPRHKVFRQQRQNGRDLDNLDERFDRSEGVAIRERKHLTKNFRRGKENSWGVRLNKDDGTRELKRTKHLREYNIRDTNSREANSRKTRGGFGKGRFRPSSHKFLPS